MTPPPHIVLASGSPRRRELLTSLGLPFEVVTSDVEEVLEPGEGVEDYVVRLARDKADAVGARFPESWVLAADTVVYLDRRVLEKPREAEDAKRMLREIAGRRHIVFTGVALVHRSTRYVETTVVSTGVDVAALSEDDIAWYVSTGEPMDKAGSYAVQGIGAMFIEAVEGNYTNVVGLPLSTVAEMFKRAGLPLTKIVRGA